jgi:hypothetical protein
MRYTIARPQDPPDNPTHAHGITAVDGDTFDLNIGHKVVRVLAFRADLPDSAILVAEYDHEAN